MFGSRGESEQHPRAIALLAWGLLLLAGCSSWSRTALAPRAEVPRIEDQRARVYLRDGYSVVLQHASVVGDSLVGQAVTSLPYDPAARHRPARAGERVAIPLADIATLEIHRFSALKTTALVVGIVGAGILSFVLVFSAIGDMDLGPF